MSAYDVVFIGSGHNALVAAAYLARAGRRVLVLERNDRPGGLVRTEALTLPGFQHDVYSSAHPLFASGPVYAELGAELEARGLRYLNTDIPTGVSMPDGSTAVLPRSMEAAIAEAERLAPGDGAVLGELLAEFGPHANDVFALFGMDLASAPARAILDRLLGGHEGPHGPVASAFAASFFETARVVVERFTSPVMRAMLAPWTLHMGRSPDDATSGFWLRLLILALSGAGMALPEGGSEKLAQALASLIRDHGGEIRTHQHVDRILVSDGRATGVRTRSGESFAARTVIASVNPDQLYLHLLTDSPVPERSRQQASRFRYGRGCVQIQLALSEPPKFRDPRFARIGQPHLSSGFDAGTVAVAQGRAGLLPDDPTFTIDCPTNLDPTRAPEGKAILRVQLLEIPCRPRGDAGGTIDVGDGRWTESLTRQFSDRVLAILEKHVPNVPSAVIGMHVTTPDSLAQFSPNQGPGDPYGGAHDLAQSYVFRPLPSQSSHQTTLPNVYMLGAATWPGHGIGGSSGYIVAQTLLAHDAR